MSRDDAYLLDMLQYATDAVRFSQGCTLDRFRTDHLVQYAILRAIEVVGEAARKVSPAFVAAHSEIPWDLIIKTRHRFAHEYGSLDLAIVWRIVTDHLPPLIATLESLVPKDSDLGETL